MNIRALMLVAGLLLAGPVFANGCPNLMADIDKLVSEKMDLDQSVKDEVAVLRTEGEALHTAGSHDESVAKLNAALALLGVE